MSLLLHYDLLARFRETYFKDLLTTMNIVEHEKHIVKMLEKGDGREPLEVPVNTHCTILEKNNKKYMMPSKYVKDLPIKIKGTPNKYSLKGDVYYFLQKTNVVSAKFEPVRTMSFKELIDSLSGFEHSNKEHYKLLTLINMAQMVDRANFRISTPAGFGKDSIVDTMGSLFGEAHTIENPTIAKLEMMTFAKLLAVNEVVDITPTEWRNIEQFLLSTGAMKNQVTKRSRAHGGVGEILDVSNLSLSLMYNDVTHYPSNTKYFDQVTKEAVKDRFPPLRLYGNFTEDFNKVAQLNINEYVKEHLDDYVKIIRAFYYYKENLYNEMHFYKKPVYKNIPERWKTSIGKVLCVVDVYSDNQEEFDKWYEVLVEAMDDYQEMLRYVGSLQLLSDKLMLPKEDFKKEPTMGFIKATIRNRARITQDPKHEQVLNYLTVIERLNTFKEKNTYIKVFEPNNYNRGIDQW